jgi:LmbE family N-acetylglucosaminyl deacetylase
LRSAAIALGVREVTLLGYVDKELDAADPAEVIGKVAAEIRRVRPHVVMTFDPQGGYGHPDHIAISQFAASAVVAAANPAHAPESLPPHAVSKFYFTAWLERNKKVYEAAFRRMVSMVDGIERESVTWPE